MLQPERMDGAILILLSFIYNFLLYGQILK